MKTLNIDIETYSDEDLTKVGVYKYADSPNFEILLFAYSIDGQPVECEDLTISEIPDEIVAALTDKNVLKIAFNAQFERVCLSKYLGVLYYLDPAQWHCTMVHANELGLPASLGQCAKYLNIEQQKDTRGTQLINFFSKPCKPTKKNDMRTRNLPEHAPEKWQTFIEYCIQDVNVEMAIANKLNRFPVPESEWKLYTLDQRINDRGAEIDHELATAAIDIMADLSEAGLNEMKELTGLENPNSLAQLKKWLEEQGTPFEKLGKEVVLKALALGNLPENVAEVLKLRLSLSNSSTKKYLMMDNARCSDNRIHGILQFYGANRTGRWAGRLLQVQNLPRNYLSEIDFARQLVKAKDVEGIELMYEDVPDTLKQLIRTGLVAKEGHRFIVSDFSAIEARVIAWYAKQDWVLEVFRTHGKIYEATAAQMFHLGEVTDYDWKSHEGKDMRQRGKVATLALGYQGGPGALKAMGALENGIEEHELQDIVDRWRTANKRIKNFWHETQKAVIDCLQNGGIKKGPRGLKFYKKSGFLFIQLPSGRKLAYAKAHLKEGDYGPAIFYEGQGDKVAFTEQQTYGGKLVENIVQATARDVLAEAMVRLEKAGYPIVFHVHDEAVAEVPEGEKSIEEMNKIMSVVPEWAEGLPLNAEGFETKYYMKD
ncbi:DNA polymerase [Enterococcus faecalis]|uniref:DNA polymerase n=1 Tax=Enterococcus faecalis TaxID=1351 RepID=UPI00141A0751|nr:DNA polymerase [Enterococcus faecalis]MBD9862104.1 DNA polymerase [Enterococcus faecalis]MBD9895445.1 DNA polymerase [Enterococcus faecalis]NIH39137.1 DNA polymerase [Enterococcus faecalis]HCT9589978.1 DNA polymerase [Enterococcus faecalis]